MKPGNRLGPYEIVAAIGAGGMGEVYKARDTRLGRDVAIKVLPAELAADPDRLRRFEQEARAVAALSHPNILALYDVGLIEASVREGLAPSRAGASPVPTSTEGTPGPYIVTELLEGDSLRERLRAGPLTPRKAIEVGAEIARGLAAAHEKGIVHRDLKPENVFVTKDGLVKILDFGIAKLTAPKSVEALVKQTTVVEATVAGTVLGTLSYMSPEQVRGLPADQRTDIFSFGCVLYEMLSGRSPFRKDTPAETMTAILHEDPAPLSGTGTEVPPVLQGIVSRCLEKGPQDRFHSAHDLASDLALLGRIWDTGTGQGPEPAEAPRRARRWVAAAAALVGASMLVLVGALLAPGWSRAPAVQCQRLTYRRGFVTAARFAPDGRTVVYSATWDGAPTELFSVRLGNPESTSLGYSHADLLAVSSTDELALVRNPRSPWGRWHPFLRAGTTFAVAPFSGGTPRDLDATVKDADYSPDGRSMAVARVGDTQAQLEYPVGTVRETTHLVGELFLCPRISPDGTRIAFFQDLGGGRGQLLVVDTRGGGPRVLADGLRDATGLAWSPSGDEVWYAEKNNLWAVTPSGRKRVIYSQTMRLTLRDVARDGRVLVTSWDRRLREFVRGPGDKADRELTWLDWTIVSDLSEDGRQIAFFESEEGAGFKMISYLRATDGSPPVRLGEGAYPRLSPDGRFAVTVKREKNEIVVYPVGPGPVRTVPITGVNISGAVLLQGNATICFSGSEPSHTGRLWLTDLAGSKPRPVTPEDPLSTQLVIRGGRYATAVLDGVYWLYPLPSGEPRRMAGVQKDDFIAAVAVDGQSALVYVRQEVPIKVYKVDLRSGDRVLFREIPLGDQAGANLGTPPILTMTPDGRSYEVGFDQTLSNLYLIEGLK